MRLNTLLLAPGLALAVAGAAGAQTPITIGMITTLSGPAGYLGEDIRDGFNLAVEMNGGQLGGRAVTLVAEDDAMRPANARQIAERMLAEGVEIFTGIIFANIAFATVPEVLESGALYISANTASASFAGEGCHANYFVSSWQDDSQGESAGAMAQALGFQNALLIAPNYQAGHETIEAFQRTFEGEIVGEIFTSLDQTDFAAEIARIRAARPDVVYPFQPGGLGIAFLRQYHQSGLLDEIPLVLHPASLNPVTLAALGEAAEGLYVSSHWNSDLPNPTNEAFMAAWRAAYGDRPATWYAAQGYDVALMVAAGMSNLADEGFDLAAFRQGILDGPVDSVRGGFTLGPNQHPVQDWYAVRAERDSEGNLALVTQNRVLEAHGDIYAGDCRID